MSFDRYDCWPVIFGKLGYIRKDTEDPLFRVVIGGPYTGVGQCAVGTAVQPMNAAPNNGYVPYFCRDRYEVVGAQANCDRFCENNGQYMASLKTLTSSWFTELKTARAFVTAPNVLKTTGVNLMLKAHEGTDEMKLQEELEYGPLQNSAPFQIRPHNRMILLEG